MHKYILFLLLLCTHSIARGQTGFDYRYWFDNDYSTVYQGHSDTGQWQMEADLDGMRESLHAIHLQVVNAKGVESAPVTRYFVKVRDKSVKQGYYWFDGDRTTQQQMEYVHGMFTIDVSKLTEGFHTFYYQVVGQDGSFSAIVSRSFYKVVLPKSARYRCWVDDEPSTMTIGKYTGEPVLVDISHLSEGYHVMRVQIEDVTPSAVVSRPFVKIPQTEGVEYLKCLCAVDDKLFREENVSSAGGIVNWNFDVSSLPQGFHRMQVQVITPSGAATGTYNAYFLRTTTDEEMTQMKCVYAIDGNDFNTEAGQMTNGAFHFDLDVAHLEDGLHRIAYKLTNGKGVETKTQTQFFIKTPLGGNGVTEYWYWLNEQGDEQARKVTLPERKDPFSLITLLPVESQPIRSKLFQFRMQQNQPVIYAKNDIHLRFYDAVGRSTDISKQFVDESVKQEVTEAEWLEAGVRATTAKPEENTIKWYCLEAEPGDSVQFRLDRAATIQLFAPSGEEVFSTSGAESVKWGGLHLSGTGTYYLALHDVTAQQGTTISLDYNHIDKYAVLRQDVRVVGNGGCNTITFDGNGFDELVSVDLVLGSDTISSTEVGHESNATMSVTFDFTGVALGQYKAVFHFVDDDLVREKCVKVEESTEFEFDVSSTYASTFLFSTGNKYVFNVQNKSNMTAYNVPLVVLIYLPDSTCLTRVDIDGYSLKDYYRNLNSGQVHPSVEARLTEMERVSGDKCYFIGTDSTTYIKGFPYVYYTYLNATLPPLSSKTISVSVKTTSSMHVYLHYPDIWPEYLSEDESNSRRALRRRTSQRCILAQTDLAKCHYDDVQEQNDKFHIRTYTKEWCAKRKLPKNCPPLPNDGHGSNGTNSFDPNEIYGYMAESQSKAVMDGLTDVYYTVQFENDPDFATAAAHEIVVTDTLDASKFDLSTFAPTSIKIGEKSAELTVDQNFVTTVDMRPEINAIAQVTGTYDQSKGIAKWHITSLDPMTMEPTDDPMDGVLPVNSNRNGIGEVSYNISLKPDLTHGTEINNRAGIVFDYNEVIMTPTWTNVIDRIAPESHVADVKMLNDSTATVSIEATDELSGPWRYDVYVQYGTGSAWWKAAENVPIDTTASVKVYEGINHGFYVVVTDSAGNVEQKNAEREFTLEVFGSQVDTDTQLMLAEGWNWVSHNQNEAMAIEGLKPSALRMVGQTEETIKDTRFGWMGDLEELLPTQMYKLQMSEAANVQLSGRLFNAGFRSIPLYEGWNWIGYPVANVMTPAEALTKLEAEEGDFIIGQDGMATFSDGQWTGTLTEMQPGLGYMYRSASNKNLFYNATAQASARQMAKRRTAEVWTVDKRKFPNVMAVVANLSQNGVTADADEWLLAAFCGDECRGVASTVNGVLMMNVYGTGSEPISFYAMNRETEEVMQATETEEFRTDVLGSMQHPYELHIGEVTGIVEIDNGKLTIDNSVYDLQGRRIGEKLSAINAQLKKGIYIVTDGKNTKTQKVVRK